jgi:APA family basic amino acid/polyamine antiporter
MAAGAVVFFAYIGFDAVSTTAEEAKNPQRDLPIGIIASLVICTILYIVVAAVLTGIVPVTQFRSYEPALAGTAIVPAAESARFLNAPVAYALAVIHQDWAAGLVSAGAVAGITSVLLVMMIGQIRIFFVMARDGLLGPWLGAVHPRYRTPHHATILTGVIVAVLAGFVQIGEAADMANIGTLFAFVLVCIGVVVLRRTRPEFDRPFRVPFMPALPVLGAIACFLLMTGLPWVTWLRFVLWTALGIGVYLAYGLRRSRLAEGT